MKLLGRELTFNNNEIWHKGNFDPASKVDKAEFDNLEIGGRNLILNSDFSQGLTNWTKTSNAISLEVGGGYRGDGLRLVITNAETVTPRQRINLELMANDTLTGQVKVKTIQGNFSNMLMRVANQLTIPLVSVKQLDNDWELYTYQVTVSSPITLSNDFGFYNTTGEFIIDEIKLERGNKATDWTPAPEDIQAELDSKAPLASPNFTGVPTAPTAPNGTNTDQIATTKFVQNALSAGGYGDMLKSQYDTDSDGIVDRAETADKLTKARTISLSGDVTGSANFDGSGNISINATVADNSHNHTISNITNLQTELNNRVLKSGDSMTGALMGYFPSTANTMVGNEYNILLFGNRRYTITQSGTGLLKNVNALFDGRLSPEYSPDGINPSNPYVLLIEGLPEIHTQTGGIFGWTSRYWYPAKYKIEFYNEYNSTGWVVVRDYSTTSTPTKDLVVRIYNEGFAGTITKIRITIYESYSSTIGANGFPRWGLSEIFFYHPEAMRLYEYLDVERINGIKITVGTTAPISPSINDIWIDIN